MILLASISLAFSFLPTSKPTSGYTRARDDICEARSKLYSLLRAVGGTGRDGTTLDFTGLEDARLGLSWSASSR
ncbi:hypothetical protein LZ554_006775 [Drepanopeziza brunnea f. sp. 'monogermtubi']|nr:hypothetical protein LZ554_006775 [Drepanopeziza brunnea f. sp. 'monogermtubi']